MDEIQINIVKLELFELIAQRFNGLLVGFFGCPPLFIPGKKFRRYKNITPWNTCRFYPFTSALFIIVTFSRINMSKSSFKCFIYTEFGLVNR